jgi:hypothetical protein
LAGEKISLQELKTRGTRVFNPTFCRRQNVEEIFDLDTRFNVLSSLWDKTSDLKEIFDLETRVF